MTFPSNNFYIDFFQTLPSLHQLTEEFFKRDILEVIEQIKGFKNIYKRTGDKNGDFINESVFINEKEKVIVVLNENGNNIENNEFSMRILYDASNEEFDLNELLSDINQRKYKVHSRGKSITLIKTGAYGLETVDFPIRSEIKSLEQCYGSKFAPVHNLIVKSLNTKKSKGIILLHGEPGTGKSFYLKHLATKIKKKKVLWLPQTAANELCSPDFITFLMENTNSVLIIEDGESVIKDREADSTNAVANLLNLTDGILSDCLHIQVIATFNTDVKNIDKALMRKGRLIVGYKFDKLPTDEANKLLKELKIDHVTDSPMTLADIYNFKQVDLSNDKRVSKKIGFK